MYWNKEQNVSSVYHFHLTFISKETDLILFSVTVSLLDASQMGFK